ncbi:ANL_collapsed_G0005660.mRNA.1.CDS.1 [Saccharomyces cerevisiae]|nr:ANL_HP_G0010040.mRNA.1.CDS.1 [Saccharomyces cerevisiae]CAI5079511.1 ANL_HP_G0098990.mRNA.1.CDS.1 [Saccharomyces cerevisiae]CAI5211924.1 ANL_HP_G0164810.mRNA.1.CDS.1 [Saccharomyces cerevisiae]CAI6517345.1 ANL_collapsed_G0005660.mRNA.1.CDS.1 [Saccharomyces cerevisiae]CAI6527146.1 ANL_HP_G0010040.mRNA.1.CDS.1 [Saccharomyces cerevisiae]
MSLKGKFFAFLPNPNTSSNKFFKSILEKKGATIVSSIQNCLQSSRKEVVILIEDSFVDSDMHLTQKDIFQREAGLNDVDEFLGKIEQSGIQCAKTSCITKWVQNDKFAFQKDDLIKFQPSIIVISDNADDGQSSTDKESEISTDVESERNDDSNNKDMIQASKPLKRLLQGDKGRASLVTDKTKYKNNELIIGALKRLTKKYEIEGEKFRARSYRLAKQSMENCDFNVRSGEEAHTKLRNIGPSIAKKIQVILDTGVLPGLNDSVGLEDKLKYFKNCYGIGSEIAKRWNLLNFESFCVAAKKDPEEFVSDWTILFGWSYYDDWLCKMSRNECFTHLKKVQKALRGIDPECQVELQGSYNRGYSKCGDIDLLFFKPFCNDTTELAKIMETLCIKLYKDGYIHCFLQLTPNLEKLFLKRIVERFRTAKIVGYGERKRWYSSEIIKKFFMGVKLSPRELEELKEMKNDEGTLLIEEEEEEEEETKLKPIDQYMSLNAKDGNYCRRLDFFCCKWDELGAGRIHYTGSKEYNRWIRILAAQKGFKLTQHGLFRNNILLESFNERRIFELLNLKYAEPEHRNIEWEKKTA